MTDSRHMDGPPVDSLRALMDAIAPAAVPIELSLPLLGAVAAELEVRHRSGEGVGLGPETITFGADSAPTLGGPASRNRAYRAPESGSRSRPTPQSDAYAFAMLAHQLLLDGLPRFSEDHPVAIAADLPEIPGFAAAALTRALDPDPAQRLDPSALLELLCAVPVERWPVTAPASSQAPPPASPAPPADRAPSSEEPTATRWTPERIQQAVLIAVVLVLLALGVIYAATRGDAPDYDPTLQGRQATEAPPAPLSAGRTPLTERAGP